MIILGRFDAVNAERYSAQLSCFEFFQKTSFSCCFAHFTDLTDLSLF